MTQHQLKSVLKDLSFQALGLSTLQLITLISQAPVTPDGMVQYIQFVPMAATMILSMYDVDGMKLRLQAIKEVAAAGGVAKLSQLNLDELRVVLESAFQEADPEGTGLLGEQQVSLHSCCTSCVYTMCTLHVYSVIFSGCCLFSIAGVH